MVSASDCFFAGQFGKDANLTVVGGVPQFDGAAYRQFRALQEKSVPLTGFIKPGHQVLTVPASFCQTEKLVSVKARCWNNSWLAEFIEKYTTLIYENSNFLAKSV